MLDMATWLASGVADGMLKVWPPTSCNENYVYTYIHLFTMYVCCIHVLYTRHVPINVLSNTLGVSKRQIWNIGICMIMLVLSV